MLSIGSLVSVVTGYFGLAAAAIAVGGFIAHVGPALTGKDEERLREATLVGGIGGLWVTAFVIVLSALIE